jgi:hypothetical protein
MQGYGKKRTTAVSHSAVSDVFQTPTSEYRQVLSQRPFACQIALEDIFNEAKTLPQATRTRNPLPAREATHQGKPWTGESLYRDLGLEANCEQEEVGKAFRRLAVKAHPDKGGEEQEFRRIQRAYETLRDPRRREQYDDQGECPSFLS